jgi:hypothetical protein
MHMDMNVFTMVLAMGETQSHTSAFMTDVTNHDSLYSRATTFRTLLKSFIRVAPLFAYCV